MSTHRHTARPLRAALGVLLAVGMLGLIGAVAGSAAWAAAGSAAGAVAGSAAWAAPPSGGAGEGPQGSGSSSRGGSTGPSGGTGTSGSTPSTTTSTTPAAAGALGRTGMWIWYVSQSQGGNLSSIIAMARRHAVGTVIVKSGDGSGYWSQFSPALVRALHRGGLKVCAWQYVYGSSPLLEAEVGARAVRAGADCLLIDAEGEYEGRYVAAQTYMRKLRSLVGARYPVGLASFPFVDYHPSFPYSVFLGPGGAQFDVPQMYWKDIGWSVDAVYEHTYVFNAPYARPIIPLGEVASSPPPAQIERFRQLRRLYRAPAASWWDWQSASPGGWNALSTTIPDLKGVKPQGGWPILAYHASSGINQGDLVVCAQEHLWSAGYRVSIDGIFGSATKRAVQRFQAAHGISTTGQVSAATWTALLHYPAANVTWTAGGARAAQARARLGGRGAARVGARSGGRGAARAGRRAGALSLSAPRSARLSALGYEIPPDLGAG